MSEKWKGTPAFAGLLHRDNRPPMPKWTARSEGGFERFRTTGQHFNVEGLFMHRGVHEISMRWRFAPRTFVPRSPEDFGFRVLHIPKSRSLDIDFQKLWSAFCLLCSEELEGAKKSREGG